MRLAPGADLSDGRLDVVWSATTGRLRFLRMLTKVLQRHARR
jgi:diacylglycerol kinase family enzyme